MRNWIPFKEVHPRKRGFRVQVRSRDRKPPYIVQKIMEFPSELWYTVEHEWLRLEGKEAVIGITDFAQRELGDIVFIEIPETPEILTKGAVFGSVEAVKTVSDLFMPVGGKILEVNAALKDHPGLLNSDPYGAGWLTRISLADETGVSGLLPPDEYRRLVS